MRMEWSGGGNRGDTLGNGERGGGGGGGVDEVFFLLHQPPSLPCPPLLSPQKLYVLYFLFFTTVKIITLVRHSWYSIKGEKRDNCIYVFH